MRTLPITLCVALSACASVGDVLPIGPETYTVSSRMGGQLPAWSEVKALSINRANEFCTSQKKQMTVVKWDTHGARGWTPLDAELTFKCLAPSAEAQSTK